MRKRTFHLFILFILMTVNHSVVVAEQNQHVISSDELTHKQTQSQVVILDLRPSEQYQKAHIPGAINIPLSSFHKKIGQIKGYVLDPIKFKKLVSDHGIQNNDEIIVYSNGAYLHSSRVLWMFEFYGHKKIRILEAGWQGWVSQNRPVSDQVTTRDKSNYAIQIDDKNLATKFQVFMATKNPDYVVIDTRSTAQYEGKKSITDVKGRIPNAITLPWYLTVTNRVESDLAKPTEKVSEFKSNQELIALFEQIPKNKKIILYCNIGIGASVVSLALKKVSIDAQIYDGSWIEWSNDASMPIEN